jgi:hypothetical protein
MEHCWAHKGKTKGQGCYTPALVRYVTLTFRRGNGGLTNAGQNAIIIRVGRLGRNCR